MADGSGGELRLGVLGPLRAWQGTAEIPLGSPQQRAVLAMLVLRDGAAVSIGELVDGLWGETPPNQAVAALRTYIGRLRAAFGRRDRDRVVTSVSGGYQLAAGLATDLGDFERRLAEADIARASGDLAEARTALLGALELWRDEPLAGLPGPFARAQRARLTEQRLAVVEDRLEIDLALGRHAEAAAELTDLVHRHPLQQHWHGLLMRALHGGGRRAEALGVYADLSRVLDRELGCEPGEELRALHARLLAEPEPGSTRESPPAAVPAQLPADITDFTGRIRQAETLRAALTAGSPVVVSGVTGTGGVGKTALAVHVAHAVRTGFPDGQLYVDLGGAGTEPAAPAVVLAGFLHALGVPRPKIPADTGERAALYRSIVDGRRVLVLLDNARDTEQVAPLLPGGEGSAALITSRAKLGGLPGRTVHLDVLDAEEALALLARLVGEWRVDAERAATLELVSACGFLPLAIRIAGARLAGRPSWTIASLAERLAGERRRLRELRVADLAVEATFDLGYAQLEPPQRRAFRLLAVVDGVGFTLPAASSILGLDEETTLPLVESLVDASLLEEPAPRHFRFHDLVKLYARQRSEAEDPDTERAAALARLLDYALATARNAYRTIEPASVLADRLFPTTAAGLPFTCPKEAHDWVAARRSVLLGTTRRAAGNPACPLRPAADLLLVVGLLADGGTAGTDLEQTGRVIVRRAGETSDPASAARAHVVLGKVALEHGHLLQAEEERLLALRLSRQTDDHLLIATCTLASGVVAVETGRYADAAGDLDEALAGYQAIDDRAGKLFTLAYLARAQLGLGNAEIGLAMAEHAVRVSKTVGPTGLAARAALHQLGNVLAELGRLDDAIGVYQESIQLDRKTGNTMHQATMQVLLAELYLRTGRPTEAMHHAELGHTAGRRIEHAQFSGLALELLGQALAELGQPDRARGCWQEALEILEPLGTADADRIRDRL
ncbi:AfsR/SARP family transcriptional regulator [Amycolatopsis anabasis]|uniref:AfsR/SARP family transcriptional regulator n=1 Tax=Amycolatopsis anabasis TaxID=1840409 RepID=UPI00131B542B|nr:BTAD domain-containing putative transcriptional regulator [Amycolatopsis anabasis]